MHPDFSIAVDSIVRWQAPVAGTYDISGFFELLDTQPTGVVGEVFRNDQLLFSQSLLGPPATQPSGPVGGMANFSLVQVLAAGDFLYFGVNNGGLYYGDSTGFDATISPIVTPLPATLPLLASGLVALGLLMRKRNKAAHKLQRPS
jgi:hypothetical protein